MKQLTPGVLFLVDSLCVGGAEKHVVTLLRNLDGARFRLSLVWLKPEEALLSEVDASRLESAMCVDVRHRVDLRAVRRIAALIDVMTIDVVVCANPYPLFHAQLARLFTRRRFRIMEVFHSTAPRGAKDRLQMLFYAPFFGATDLLVYVCEAQRCFWRARGLSARHDRVIHNGVDVAYYDRRPPAHESRSLRAELGFAASDYVVGLCAALRPEKAPLDLVRAIACLRDRGVAARALLIGDGPQRAVVEELAGELGMRDSVVISGFRDDVRPWIDACDVMTLVSRTETFSLAALESMALGKPLVLSDVGGAGEQVENGVNGLRFPAGDVTALAASLAALLDPEMRQRMGRESRRMVQRRFTLDRMVRAFSEEIERLSNSGAYRRASAA